MIDSVNTLLYFIQKVVSILTQHPCKEIGGGCPVVCCPLLLYTDDTSGNLTKKWNKFDVWCFLLGALPRSENAKLENIHFISCSNSVSGEKDSYYVYMCIIIL